MNLRRTKAVARKEFLHIIRDPRSLAMALAVPLVMLLLFGYALSLDVDRIPTLIYDADRSYESRRLVERFQGSRYFEILGMPDNYKTIEIEIDRNECLMGVVIPKDYSKNLLSGKTAEAQILIDGSDSNTASIALGYAESLLQIYSIELKSEFLNRRGGGRLAPPIETRLRVWYNSELKSRNYIVPGLIAVILMIITANLTSLTIAREWETGTMEQILSTPLRPKELVMGKLTAFFCLGLIDMLITIGAGVIFFHIPMRGSIALLFFTGCVFLFGVLCWGILISAIARSQLLAYQMGAITSFLPAFLLSGFIYAIENMPWVIQIVTHIVPARYFITILRGIFLKGVGIKILWFETALLIIFAWIIFVMATRKVKQKLM